MPLNEEKKVVSEINSLTQLKTLVKDYHQKVYETSDNYKKEQNEKRIKVNYYFLVTSNGIWARFCY